MRTLAAVFLSWLHTLGLCLWLGGIGIVGAVVAPAVFGSAKAAGQTEWGQPLYTFAGTVMTEAFRRFSTVVLVAGAVMLLAGLGYGRLAGMCPRRLLVRAALTAAALASAAWAAFSLMPPMLAAQAAGRMDVFDPMHHTYSTVFRLQLVLLLGVAALTGWLHLDRTPHGARAGAGHGRLPGRVATADGEAL